MVGHVGLGCRQLAIQALDVLTVRLSPPVQLQLLPAANAGPDV